MTDIDITIKKKYCINCGKMGHYNKECTDPITSAGIILFKINKDNINKFLKKDINIEYFINKFNRVDNKKIVLNESKNILDNVANNILDFLKENIYFLLIQRKQSLGYIEFIRGRYDINDIELLASLFNQMTKQEMMTINENRNNFYFLWEKIWGDNFNDIYIQNEYINSKNKFIELCNNKILNELLNCKPLFETPEWGFPKGRRNYRENNIACAKREFFEETNIKDDEYNILNGIYPLVEVMTGTNEKKYKHIYYIGICDNDCKAYIEDTNLMQTFEIGDISWYNYNDSIMKLRTYHIEKKRILNIIFSFIVGQIMKYKTNIMNSITKIEKKKTNQINI
jgi:hypothetical protein